MPCLRNQPILIGNRWAMPRGDLSSYVQSACQQVICHASSASSACFRIVLFPHRLVGVQCIAALVDVHGDHCLPLLHVPSIRLLLVHDHAEQCGLASTITSNNANNSAYMGVTSTRGASGTGDCYCATICPQIIQSLEATYWVGVSDQLSMMWPLLVGSSRCISTPLPHSLGSSQTKTKF